MHGLRHLAGPRVLLLTGALLAIGVVAPGEFGVCGPNKGIEVSDIILTPATPHTNTPLQVDVLGSVPGTAGGGLRASSVNVEAVISICRRFKDCMGIFTMNRSLCSLMGEASASCADLLPGKEFNISSAWKLPLLMIRGSYSLTLQLSGQDGEVSACYEMRGVEVLASRPINVVRDYRDAMVAFVIAASSSRAMGVYFPTLSGGVLPQISGFLLMGILIGPYCTNLVSRLHIFLIGNLINRVALAFIAGAAGAEIFVPELLDLLVPMTLQVVLISTATVLLCSCGLLLMVSYEWVSIPALALQPSLAARGAVALLMAALMTARSPASIIAVVSEMNCSATKAAKVAIGITVLSDIVVLILFSLCSSLVHVAWEGGGMGPQVLLGVFSELGASAVLGFLAGGLLLLVIPPVAATEETHHHQHHHQHRLSGDGIPFDPSKSERPSEATGPGGSSQGPLATVVVAVRGALLIVILYAAFIIASEAHEWTNGRAGVTLGLVLEVERNFKEPWARHFGTLVIGVVVLNQLLGPVLCRVGLRRIVEAEATEDHGEESNSTSEEDSRSSSDGHFGIEAYDALVRQSR